MNLNPVERKESREADPVLSFCPGPSPAEARCAFEGARRPPLASCEPNTSGLVSTKQEPHISRNRRTDV